MGRENHPVRLTVVVILVDLPNQTVGTKGYIGTLLLPPPE